MDNIQDFQDRFLKQLIQNAETVEGQDSWYVVGVGAFDLEGNRIEGEFKNAVTVAPDGAIVDIES